MEHLSLVCIDNIECIAGDELWEMAIFAILLSCVGKLAAAIQMIPLPVMGGVSLLLYGVIGASGIRVLILSLIHISSGIRLPDCD